MRRQLTKDNVKDFCMVQNKLQHPFIPIYVSHAPFSQGYLKKFFPLEHKLLSQAAFFKEKHEKIH